VPGHGCATHTVVLGEAIRRRVQTWNSWVGVTLCGPGVAVAGWRSHSQSQVGSRTPTPQRQRGRGQGCNLTRLCVRHYRCACDAIGVRATLSACVRCGRRMSNAVSGCATRAVCVRRGRRTRDAVGRRATWSADVRRGRQTCDAVGGHATRAACVRRGRHACDAVGVRATRSACVRRGRRTRDAWRREVTGAGSGPVEPGVGPRREGAQTRGREVATWARVRAHTGDGASARGDRRATGAAPGSWGPSGARPRVRDARVRGDGRAGAGGARLVNDGPVGEVEGAR
jgi:hypothetical protein